MPDNKYSDADVNVRALLMKLYHSRQIGEAFYHAAFVNGEAPKLEADGLIERHGEGWRLTQDGLQAWAEMNAHLFESNQWYRGAVFAEMRTALLREGRSSMTGICNKEGCGQPRHMSIGGHEFTFCTAHMIEKWDADKRGDGDEANLDVKPNQKGKIMNLKVCAKDGCNQPRHLAKSGHEYRFCKDHMGALKPSAPKAEKAVTQMPPEAAAMQAVVEVLENHHPTTHECSECGAKAVIEALRGKSPKLAKLIDAMQAEVEAARELGL
jgi:hypothetical protein